MPVPSTPSDPSDFPHVLESGGRAASFEPVLDGIRDDRDRLLATLDRVGAILFRGYPVRSAHDFDRLIEAFGLPVFTYAESLSNAVRTNVTPRVFTANEAPPSVDIYLHHEMAQTPRYPEKLFFFCEIAPDRGGATPLCRSDIVARRLERAQPELFSALERLGVRYSHTMPATPDLDSGQGRSWQDTLDAPTRAEAEGRLQRLGYTWRWQDTGDLHVTTPSLPAVRRCDDGTPLFFNQLIAAFRGWSDARNDPRQSIRYGDGTAICAEAMRAAIEIADETTYDLQWQVGDVAIVDNYLVMHGRRSYSGQRRVLASLAGSAQPPPLRANGGARPQ